METAASHYPGFNVLAEQEAWDEYSRSIVLQRLDPAPPSLLNEHEADTLRAVVANLMFECRADVINFVVSNIDSRLRSPIGESERKPKAPPQDALVRQGVALLDAIAAGSSQSDTPFKELKAEHQSHILQTLQKGKHMTPHGAPALPQKDLFKKLLTLTVDAYASHPDIWSDMGYAGPAYPRGYYRIELGLHDPWEARAETFSAAQAEGDRDNG